MFTRRNVSAIIAIAVLAIGLAVPAAAADGTATLTVSVSGPGNVSGPGINCGNGGSDCTETYDTCLQMDREGFCSEPDPKEVTLTSTPATGYVLSGWGGACSGNASTCDLTLYDDESVGATFVDGTAPSVQLTSPAHGAWVKGAVTVTADASDPQSGISRVEFWVRPQGGGSFSQFAQDTSAPYAASLATTSLSPPTGDYEVMARAVNGVGMAAGSVRTLRVDNTAPTVDLTLPAEGAYLGGSIALRAGASDVPSDGLDYVAFQHSADFGTLPVYEVGVDNAAPFEATFDTTSVADGPYQFGAAACDKVVNCSVVDIADVTIDNTVPFGTFVAPAADAQVRGKVAVEAAPDDVTSPILAVDIWYTRLGSGDEGSVGSPAAAPWKATWDTTSVSDGNYELSARVYDAAGNSTVITRTVTVDNTAPNAKITKGPRKKTTARKARFAFKSSEPGSIFMCKLDKKAWKRCSSPKTYKKLRTGRHTFQVKARDRAGNVDPTPAKRTWKIV